MEKTMEYMINSMVDQREHIDTNKRQKGGGHTSRQSGGLDLIGAQMFTRHD